MNADDGMIPPEDRETGTDSQPDWKSEPPPSGGESSGESQPAGARGLESFPGFSGKRYLIVNADDFGQSAGINQGVIKGHEQGIVTSASLMVRWPAAAEAADYARTHAGLSLGLHIDLGEWICRDDAWTPLYEVISLNDLSAVAEETSRQLAAFRRLLGRDPTHIDSHQHVHRWQPVRDVLIEMAGQLAVPLRDCSPEVRYCGAFYGQTAKGDRSDCDAISVDGLLGILKALPQGVTELGCHPGEGDDIQSMYRTERAQEVNVLCNPTVREQITAEGIELCSFGDIARLRRTL